MKAAFAQIVVVLTFSAAAPHAQALLISQSGNDPISAQNYTDWPGIDVVVNHRSRVHHLWCNGYERSSFRGDAQTLTEVLLRFAVVKSEKLEVILRPFNDRTPPGKHAPVDIDWILELRGGISRHMVTLKKEEMTHPTFPVLTVYVGGRLSINDLKIPKRLRVIGLSELKERYLDAIQSSSPWIRGSACALLADIDSRDERTMKAIAALLDDDDEGARRSAVNAIGRFGPKAKAALVDLRMAAASGDTNLEKAANESIELIDRPPIDDSKDRRDFREMTRAIDEFVRARDGNEKTSSLAP